jgi:hypothetical membrane protein
MKIYKSEPHQEVWTTQNIAGILLFLAGIVILMGIITCEIYYPSGYNTRNSQISDLGATVPPKSIITQPSAIIFNFTMIASGLMISIANILLNRYSKKWFSNISLGLMGLGILGVGIFPENIDPWHGLLSMITFISGGIAAIASYQIVKPPLRYVFILLGLTTLVFYFRASDFIPLIGAGGTERWVAYPIVCFLMGFGVYVMNIKFQNYENK